LAVAQCFGDASRSPARRSIPVAFKPARNADLLVTVLEEVIDVAGVLGVVPVAVDLLEAEDGGLAGSFEAVPIGSVGAVGPTPKGIAHDVDFDRDAVGWTCRVLVDV
jgi:hypothetical protein